MNDAIIDLLYILNRYIHILCTTVIVGGTLFYEVIVPVAIHDLKAEQQLSVFGRARWGFRSMVWSCAILLIVSGVVSSLRRWQDYRVEEGIAAVEPARPGRMSQAPTLGSELRRPGWWWAAHASAGFVALCVAVSLMTVRRPPSHPLYWMRLSLMMLLVVIFLATTARHMRLSNYEAEHLISLHGARD